VKIVIRPLTPPFVKGGGKGVNKIKSPFIPLCKGGNRGRASVGKRNEVSHMNIKAVILAPSISTPVILNVAA